ncbi:MAG: tRNA (guanosine(37)-N1)-methyltransferase TrmD [Candidatus Hydrogenedentota bacterium]|jgi:tRNA (guanine37-N1)-methyltransferase
MRIDVLTLFPEMFAEPLKASLLGKAMANGILEVAYTNPRDFSQDIHRTVDDAPYGGGPGMVMKCEPMFAAVESLREVNTLSRTVLLSPRGRKLTQPILKEWAQAEDLVLICGRYEGFDERISERLCTDEVSIGDYVLSGGEFPAMVIIDALSRMLPGVVGDFESVETDSFYDGILGAPQYTRPPEFLGMEVPEVLRDGNHALIARYRRKEALRVTRARRPELLEKCSAEDRALLQEIEEEESGS